MVWASWYKYALDENPFSGHLFIFHGRKGDIVKILWAEADGLCLFTKRLEECQFIGLLYAMEKLPSLAHNLPCSSINWTGVSPKQYALTH